MFNLVDEKSLFFKKKTFFGVMRFCLQNVLAACERRSQRSHSCRALFSSLHFTTLLL